MGFRCPSCKKNFGTDKKAFDKHFVLCTGATVEDICTDEFGENYVKNLVYESTVGQDIKEILMKIGKDTDT